MSKNEDTLQELKTLKHENLFLESLLRIYAGCKVCNHYDRHNIKCMHEPKCNGDYEYWACSNVNTTLKE